LLCWRADFEERVNYSAWYCVQNMQLAISTKAVCKKRHRKLWQNINILHDNAYLHMAGSAMMTLAVLSA
jgi:hypothetical protein